MSLFLPITAEIAIFAHEFEIKLADKDYSCELWNIYQLFSMPRNTASVSVPLVITVQKERLTVLSGRARHGTYLLMLSFPRKVEELFLLC